MGTGYEESPGFRGCDAALMERVAQRFRHDMWASVVPEAVTEAGIEIQRFGPLQATVFGELPKLDVLSQILGAAEPAAIADGHMARAVEWMRAHEVDYRVPVAANRPGSEEAEAWLGERGFERGGTSVKLVRDTASLDLPEVTGVVVYELGADEVDGEGLSTIIPDAFGMPPMAGALFFSLPLADGWRCYTAALAPEGEIVATASMLIQDGVAQLGPGATLEQGRGRGCNRALLRRRLLDAAEAGCHTVFVELGECDPELFAAVRANLLRAGFGEAYGSRIWRRPSLRLAAVR